MRRALPAALLLACALAWAAPAQAQQVEPGVEVPALIGLNWEATPAPQRDAARLRPLVTATVTTELSVSGLNRASAAWGLAAGGSSPLRLDPAEPALVRAFPGGGVTGRPAPIVLRSPARPDARDLQVLISLTSGP